MPVNKSETNFNKLIGRPATIKELKQLLQIKQHLGLEDNDALWLVIMALQHYDTLYSAVPKEIERVTQALLVDFRVTAQAQIEASIASTIDKSLAAQSSSNEEQQAMFDIFKSWKKLSVFGLFIAFIVAGSAWFSHRAGVASGFELGLKQGYAQAHVDLQSR